MCPLSCIFNCMPKPYQHNSFIECLCHNPNFGHIFIFLSNIKDGYGIKKGTGIPTEQKNKEISKEICQ